MNRRAFLTALGAVATQQKLRTLNIERDAFDGDVGPPPITVSRFPYIQNVRSDRASILWATFEAGFGQVRYSSDGVNFRSVTAKSRFFSRNDTGTFSNFVQYQADLTGLTPNTDYVY